MQNANQQSQLSFDIEAVVSSTKAGKGMMVAAMNNLADRIHTKIEIMLSQGSLAKNIPLSVKEDDKAMFSAALDEGCSNATFSRLASMMSSAGEKVYFDYDDAEQLFAALNA
tara:strand:+ start:3154 stop:3489 length:336 start_codon:yes stop_codon:yes gene_type:complete